MILNFALNTIFDQAQLVFQRLNSSVLDYVRGSTNHVGVNSSTGASAMPPSTPKILACAPKSNNTGRSTSYSTGQSTGYGALDAALINGGWPEFGTVEVVADNFAFSELALFLPLLVKITQAKQQVAWISPPQMPHLPTLQDHGIATENLQIVMAYGHTSYWAAAQALRAGNARVLLYWPEASVNVNQRNALSQLAHTSGTLLFMLVASDETINTDTAVRLLLGIAPASKPQQIDGWSNAVTNSVARPAPSAADLLVNTRAIIFEPQSRATSASKRKKSLDVPMLNGISYSSAFAAATCPTREEKPSASFNHAAAADAWVTVLSGRPGEAVHATKAFDASCATNTAIPISVKISKSAAALAKSNVGTNIGVQPTSTLSKVSATPAHSKPVQNKPETTIETTQRRPILGHLQTSVETLQLAETRIDVLRLNRFDRLVSVNLPAGSSASVKLATPSRRARLLARNNLRTSAAEPLVGQTLLRQQAKNASKARNTQQAESTGSWAPSNIKLRTAQNTLAQQQLA